jgi:hypothetical protein
MPYRIRSELASLMKQLFMGLVRRRTNKLKRLLFQKEGPPPAMIPGQGMKQDRSHMYSKIDGNQPHGYLVHFFDKMEKSSGLLAGCQIKKH